jgi:hypothetical protein
MKKKPLYDSSSTECCGRVAAPLLYIWEIPSSNGSPKTGAKLQEANVVRCALCVVRCALWAETRRGLARRGKGLGGSRGGGVRTLGVKAPGETPLESPGGCLVARGRPRRGLAKRRDRQTDMDGHVTRRSSLSLKCKEHLKWSVHDSPQVNSIRGSLTL